MNKVLGVVCAGFFAVSVFTWGSPATAADVVTLTFGGSDAIGTVYDRQNKMFTRLVNERAKGRLKVNFIEGDALGSDIQVIEQMMEGAIHLYGDANAWYGSWIDDFSIFNWGFLFRDYEHQEKFLASPTWDTINEKLRKKIGVRILAVHPMEPRIMFSRKPVKGLEDLQGIKMRMPEVKAFHTMWQALGTNTARVVWSEVFMALKTGVVDACDGPICSAMGIKLHQAATYVYRTDHVFSNTHIAMNDKMYQSLAPDLQKILVDAADEATKWARDESLTATEGCHKQMEAEGATVGYLDLEPFKKKLEAVVYDVEKEGLWTVGLYDEVMAIK